MARPYSFRYTCGSGQPPADPNISITALEFDSQTELNLAISCGCLAYEPDRASVSSGAEGGILPWYLEVGPVEDVEKFGPKLNIHIFPDRGVLG